MKPKRIEASQKRKSEYKPLLFTTTLRNPERLRDFLIVFKEFDGQVLTNDLATKVEGELVRRGFYRPTQVSDLVKEKWNSGDSLSDSEVSRILGDNPQNHKERGFDKGWPSRFDTHYKMAKFFGCVFYEVGELIEFSEIGNFCVSDETGAWQEVVFLNGLSKYHRDNPFKRVSNKNRPLSLLIETLEILEQKLGPNNPGIAKHELSIVGIWKNNDANALVDEIIKMRQDLGHNISDEVLFKRCKQLGGWTKSMKVSTITHDLPDDFLRKLRLTGLFVLRGGGRYLSLSKESKQKAKRVRSKHKTLQTFMSEREYFDFVADYDAQLIDLSVREAPTSDPNRYQLTKWIAEIGLPAIRENLALLATRRPSKHELLSILDEPLRLEFLVALLVADSYPSLTIQPNYRCDDEGLPLSTAPGGMADIAVIDGSGCINLEVTMMRGRQQVHLEMLPIERHLVELDNKYSESAAIFIAPDIHADAKRYSEWIMEDKGIRIETLSISDFLENCATCLQR